MLCSSLVLFNDDGLTKFVWLGTKQKGRGNKLIEVLKYVNFPLSFSAIGHFIFYLMAWFSGPGKKNHSTTEVPHSYLKAS